MVDLGTLGEPDSSAVDVNASGQVVGVAFAANLPATSGQPRAFSWTASGGMIDLNAHIPTAPQGVELLSASAVSDNGAIVATSNTGLVLLRKSPRAGG